MQTTDHERYMRQALQEARAAAEAGEVPAGCVILSEVPGHAPRIVGRAHNRVERLKDPTAHAERLAITQAAATLGDWRLTPCTLYVTKEPCLMCAGAIVLARIRCVVFGVADPRRGAAVSLFNALRNPRLNHRCEVVHDVLAGDCRRLLRDFFKARRDES